MWLAFILMVISAPAALAACHRFDLAVSPTTVSEGENVSVTVSRDGTADDSHVTVAAVSGTAQSGADFSPLNQQVNFTGNATQRSFQISIVDDRTAEPAETFTVRLSNPGGCSGRENFSLADPVQVTIRASQAPAPPPPPPPAVSYTHLTLPTKRIV